MCKIKNLSYFISTGWEKREQEVVFKGNRWPALIHHYIELKIMV